MFIWFLKEFLKRIGSNTWTATICQGRRAAFVVCHFGWSRWIRRKCGSLEKNERVATTVGVLIKFPRVRRGDESESFKNWISLSFWRELNGVTVFLSAVDTSALAMDVAFRRQIAVSYVLLCCQGVGIQSSQHLFFILPSALEKSSVSRWPNADVAFQREHFTFIRCCSIS